VYLRLGSCLVFVIFSNILIKSLGFFSLPFPPLCPAKESITLNCFKDEYRDKIQCGSYIASQCQGPRGETWEEELCVILFNTAAFHREQTHYYLELI
jgi:hypothetical protein